MATKINKINIDNFLKLFRTNYTFLYEHKNAVAGYREAVEAFDEFVKEEKNKQFVCDFVTYRGDFISSDREAAAFMFTLCDLMPL